MFVRISILGWIIAMSALLSSRSIQAQPPLPKPLVIAHRGASGYLPEHTEGAKVLAVAQGADFIEQDVVLSRDKVFVVCHDITLHETTDVANRFPDRKRSDGRYYAADFDWLEIAQLSVFERHGSAGKQQYSARFPGSFHQRLMRLEDEIKLLQGLGQTLARPIGIYVELKRPAWHRDEMGVDMSRELLSVLTQFGYKNKSDWCFVQCFEAEELQHLRNDLKCPLPLVQLMGGKPPEASGNGVNPWEKVISEISLYADAIGPALEMIATRDGDRIQSTGLIEAARTKNLSIHPYTVRKDALPKWASSLDQLHAALRVQFHVEGWFTDFPDLSVAAR